MNELIELNKEFKEIILAIENDKYIILNLKKKNYIEIITIMPHEIKGYCHISRINSNEMIEQYTKRGIINEYISTYLQDIKLSDYDIKIKEYIEFNNKDKIYLTNVYIIQGDDYGLIKIGKTNDIETRLNQIQNMSPIRLKVIYLFENVRPVFEIYLHEKYDKYRVYGEWFDNIILEDVKNEKSIN